MNKLDHIRNRRIADVTHETNMVDLAQQDARRMMDQQALHSEIVSAGGEWSHVPEVHDDPTYRRELRKALADLTAPPAYTRPAEGYASTLRPGTADAIVTLPMRGGKPQGFLKQGIDEWRLRFSGFEVSLGRQYHASTRLWREWMHEEFGQFYRSSFEPLPDDWNARACLSSLYGVDDVQCEGTAVVGDAAVMAIWDGHALEGLWVIRGFKVDAGVVRETHAPTWSGYKCGLSLRT